MILISPFLNYLICHTDKSCIKKLLFILVFIPIYVQFNRCTVSDIIALMICFLVFQKKAFYNPIINKLALCVLGVYLLHEQSLIDFSNTLDFLINKCIDFGFINFGWFFPLQYFAIVLLVYVLATIFEYIRLLIIQKPFMKYISIKFSKQINRIDESLNSLK